MDETYGGTQMSESDLTGSIIVAVAVLLLGALGWVFYTDSQRPTIELKKAEWECVKSEQRTSLMPMLVGKTTILQPRTSTICVEYRRRAG